MWVVGPQKGDCLLRSVFPVLPRNSFAVKPGRAKKAVTFSGIFLRALGGDGETAVVMTSITRAQLFQEQLGSQAEVQGLSSE